MLTEHRQEVILNIINEKGSVTVSELREKFGISESTARRDLTELDRAGKLTKVFGGAIAAEGAVTTTELSVTQKLEVNIDEKMKIAKYAASLIEPDDFVFIDAGTTTECMIDFLTCKEATYVTNAVLHGRKMAQKGLKVIMIGGELKAITEAIVGGQALLDIRKYHFTKGFFGTKGISMKNGFTTPDYSEAMTKEAALANSEKGYVLADADKFRKTSSVTFGAFDDAIIITNEAPTGHYANCNNILVVQ